MEYRYGGGQVEWRGGLGISLGLNKNREVCMDREGRRKIFRAVRIQLGMSQGKLGECMGIAASDISALETGRGGRAPTRVHMRFLAWIKLAHDAGLNLQGEIT